MKKIINTLFVLFLISFNIICKSQNYIPFPVTNTLWTEVYYPPDDTISPWKASFHCYGLLNNDTIINSKKYHKLYKSNDTIFDESEYCGAIREDSLRRVYYFGNLTKFKYKDVLLFNFLVKIGDTLANKYGDTLADKYNFFLSYGDFVVVESIDSIYLSGKYRKRINFDHGNNSWVEGIGNINRGLLFPLGIVPNNGISNQLVCLKQNYIWIYHYSYYSNCFPYYLNDINNIKLNTTDVIVSPNPVSNISYIKFDNTIHQYEEIEIISIIGRKVKLCKFNNQTTYSINKHDYSKGIYLIRLTSKDGFTINGKFIIE